MTLDTIFSVARTSNRFSNFRECPSLWTLGPVDDHLPFNSTFWVLHHEMSPPKSSAVHQRTLTKEREGLNLALGAVENPQKDMLEVA